jgi:SAM-dependent methyltransferase
MPFKQYVRAEVAEGLDETYQFETWANDVRSGQYHDVHVSVIKERETSADTLSRFLAGSRKRILESGCGTGRWIAFFDRLGHEAHGVDDSSGPLRVARHHAPTMRLARADVIACPFPDAVFDAVFSSYVAEHFVDGPEELFREIHRLLKPDGLLLVVVPYNNWFRRLFTNRVLGCFYVLCRLRGRALAFTEFRYSQGEMTRALQRSGFRVEHVEPDDFHFPWGKGLSLDLGPLVRPRGAAVGSWELNRFGRLLARVLNAISPWACAAGILIVARRVAGREE